MKRFKKGISIALSVAMTVGMFPEMTLKASASVSGSGIFGEPENVNGYQAYVLDDGETYTLTDDVDLEGFIYVPDNVTATIDLNGYTIDRGLSGETVPTEDGRVILVEGNLTLEDSSADQTGKVTGGYVKGRGAGVNAQGGEFTLTGGTITGNRAENSGNGQGGGVYIGTGIFNFNGGAITGNTATGDGGGVYVLSYSMLNIGGKVICKDNTRSENTNNVYIAGNAKAYVNYMEEGSCVGIKSKASNDGILLFMCDNNENLEYFFSDSRDKRLELTGNYNEYAHLVPNLSTLTINESENGTVTVAGGPQFIPGDRIDLTVTPDEGYVLKTLEVLSADGYEKVALNGYSFTMPEYDVAVTATFEEPGQYWIDVKTDGGSIRDVPIDRVTAGETVTLRAEPDVDDMTVITFEAYMFNPDTFEYDQVIPGITHPSIDTISFPMPSSDVEVFATFSDHDYVRVFMRDMENGTVEADKEVVSRVDSETVNLTIRPDNGYRYVEDSLRIWEYRGPVKYKDPEENKYNFEEVVPGSVYSLTVRYDTEVYAEFEEAPHTTPYDITVNETENGIIVSDLDTAEEGWTVTLSVNPEERSYYALDHLEVKGASSEKVTLTKVNDTTYTFIMPGEDVVVSGDFAVPVHPITIVNNDPCDTGSHIVDLPGYSSFEYGSHATVPVYLSPDSNLDSITVTGDESGDIISCILESHNEGSAIYYYRFAMPDEAVTVTADFSATRYALSASAEMSGEVLFSVNDGAPSAYASAAKGNKVKVIYTPDPVRYVSALKYSFVPEGRDTAVTLSLSDQTREGNTYAGVFTMPSGDVTVSSVFDKGYAINITQPDGGTILASGHRADAGETVTLRAYSLEYDSYKADWTVTYEDGNGTHEVPVTHSNPDPDDYVATFTMPEGDVDVSVTIDHIGTPYNDRKWNLVTETVSTQVNYHYGCTDLQSISGNELSSGWYLVTSSRTFNDRLVISGNVSIILADGVTLTCNEGIGVRGSSTLSIYGQGDDTGKIVANGSKYDAGIGADDSSNHGNIKIYGGTIDATGGNYAAGIGQGDEAEGSCGTISIFGGDVTAHGGGDAAGIGGGNEGRGSNIIIYGGIIHATGGQYGAGIGAGDDRGPSTIEICGGTVVANGGEYAAGIGEGYDASDDTSNGVVRISGSGTVSATGGKLAAGIGGGFLNNTSMKIYISGGSVEAFGGNKDEDCGGAGIGAGSLTSIRAVHLSGGDFNGEVVISGGKVTAIADGHAGDGEVVYGCAGIGGGFGGNLGGNVTISGGEVKAVGYAGGAAIGAGSEFITGYGGETTGTVSITGGSVELKTNYPGKGDGRARIIGRGDDGDDDGTVTLGSDMCVINGGYSPVLKANRVSTLQSPASGSVYVMECDHEDVVYTYANSEYHNAACIYCDNTSLMPHYYSDGVCVECGAKGVPVYFYDDGELIHYQALPESGGLVEKPEDPEKDGCTFMGWYIYDEEEGYTLFDFSVPVTEETTLEAIWKVTVSIESYSVTDKTYGVGGKVAFGEDGTPATYDEAEVISGLSFLVSASADIGYHFVGWAYKNDLETIISENAELTLTAGPGCELVALFEEGSDKIFTAHSLCLGGDIGVNFMLNLTEEQRENAVVNFFWFVDGKEKNASFDLKDAVLTDYGYKAVCHVAPAEMTCDIYATVTINGVENKELDVYSAKAYADVILSAEYAEKYKSAHSEEEYTRLKNLVDAMLDYGSRAQIKWDINYYEDESRLANGGTYSNPGYIADDIPDTTSDMYAGLDGCGLEYVGTTTVMLSETSLRHYYKVVNPDLFELVKDSVTFNGVPVTPVTKGDNIYFELTGIAAADIDTVNTLTIGGDSYNYAVTDYIRLILQSDDTEELVKTKDLVTAMYYYNKAADAYLGD